MDNYLKTKYKLEMSFLKLFVYAITFIACFPVYETLICGFNPCSFGNPCENGGTCETHINCTVNCICLQNFDGKFCEQSKNNIAKTCRNECTQDTCNNHGNCTFYNESCKSECKCEPGYTGRQCDREKCHVLVCVHGNCIKLTEEMFQCQCDDGWIGQTCNIQCSRNCSNGDCIIRNKEEMCACQGKFLPSSNCTEEEKKDILVTEWDKRYLGFLAIPLILSIVLIIMVYVMWRYRLTFILKIIYTFQNYEDHDGKEYDAFISFRSASPDELWVFNTLFPTLEKEMGFKLCVHFRDFLVGETICNNIINAVEKSRRTILVLSPDYVISEWTRLEYQVAHQEMLKKHQKIIPIIYRDINVQELDKNLAYIMKSITYLEWPHDTEDSCNKSKRFWEKLRLTMPKKRETSLLNENSKEDEMYTEITRF